MGHLTVKEGYKSFADRLNLLPQGAPVSNTLYTLLEELVDEKEAKILSLLPVRPFTAAKAAKALKKSETETEKILVELAQKAMLLDVVNKDEERVFVLPPPMAGFFEFSLMRMGSRPNQAKVAELFHQYINVEDEFITHLFVEGKTKLGRVFVNDEALDMSRKYKEAHGEQNALGILDYESAGKLVEKATKVAVGTCYCRHKKFHMGTHCDAPMDDICMTLGNVASSLTKYGHAREISKSEGIQVLERAYAHNLVQISENAQNEIPFICNCCGCCCEALLAVKKFGTLACINTTNFLPEVYDSCVGCGACEKTCPVDAISRVEVDTPDGGKKKRARVDASVCLGCGVCVRTCKFNALFLNSRGSRIITPVNSAHRIVLMAVERGKLQNLIFENQALMSHRVMASILGAIIKLEPAKKALASQQMQSFYLKNFL